MAASKTIGGINVTITATIDKFQKAMTAAQRILGGFMKAVKNAVFSLKGLAVALALGAFTKMTANAFQAVDAMGELSDKLGVSTEKLYGLQLAASEAGVSQETLERAMVALNKAGMGGEKGLREWIDKTSKLSTHQEKLAAATEMFGSRGSSMVRMLTGGTAALDEAQQASEKLGWSLSRSAVAGVERAMDAIGRLKAAVGGIFANLAIEIAPYIEVLSGKITDAMGKAGGSSGIGKAIADTIIKMAKLVADGIQSMVGGVLSMVADVKQMILGLRTSSWGVRLGMGYSNNKAAQDAGSSAHAAWMRADRFNNGTKWSDKIEGWAAKAREAAAAQAASAPASQGDGLLGKIGKRFADSLLSGITAKAQGAAGPLQDWLKMQGTLLGVQAGMDFSKSTAAASSAKSALSFAESGSADSYRQQAAIRKQNEGINLDKQRNGILKDILIASKTPPVLMAANFGGR